MKLITRNTDYAVKALRYIHRNKGRVVTAKELSRELAMPSPFLRSVLQVLKQKKLLKSFKGRGGGFLLFRHPDDILLTDLMRIFQGPLSFGECLFKKKPCPDIGNCELNRQIVEIEREVADKLNSISLASLL